MYDHITTRRKLMNDQSRCPACNALGSLVAKKGDEGVLTCRTCRREFPAPAWMVRLNSNGSVSRVTMKDLRFLVAEGFINRDTEIMREGSAWTNASQIAELFPATPAKQPAAALAKQPAAALAKQPAAALAKQPAAALAKQPAAALASTGDYIALTIFIITWLATFFAVFASISTDPTQNPGVTVTLLQVLGLAVGAATVVGGIVGLGAWSVIANYEEEQKTGVKRTIVVTRHFDFDGDGESDISISREL